MVVAEGLEAPRFPSDVFVEGVRVLIVATATAVGSTVAGAPGAALGACGGYVVGGVMGRWLRRATGRFEDTVDGTPAITLAAGVVGALALGAMGAIVGLAAVLLLPGRWGYGVLGLAAWIGVYAGFQVGARKGAELLDSRSVLPSSPTGLVLVDSSAAMDGRLLALGGCDFLTGHLAVPRFVLDELNGLADASDPIRRRRARRGLEVLDALGVEVLPDEVPQCDDMAEKLAVVAERLGAPVLTAHDLERLSDGLRSDAVPGEVVQVRLTREGRDPGQAVGFLDDGAMVVVSDAVARVGDDVDAEVVTSVPTAKGRLYFAVLRA
jgi:uncharacterized protein YacL